MENTENVPAWASSFFLALQQQLSAQTQQQLKEFRQELVDQTNSTIPTVTPESSQAVEATIPVGGIGSTEPRRKDRLPSAPEFEGRRSEFRSWRDQINAKLNVDLAREDQAVQAWYIHSRLRGRALQQVTPWVNTTIRQHALTPDGLLYQLQIAYDDPESAERAARKLNTLRQGTKAFNSFLAEFERILLDAGGIDWTDQVKKTFLNNSLSTELQTAIIATPIPASYREYCTLLQMVSHNLDSIQNRKQLRTGRPRPADNANAMDWEPTPVIAATAEAKRAKWVLKETMDQRRDSGACLRCGQRNHRVIGCPLLPAKRPTNQIQTASITTNQTPLGQNQMEDLSDSDSGKE